MTKAQARIRELIDQLETEHGIVPAFRVTRHLAAAYNELAKPLGPKPAKEQVRAVGSIARNLAVVAGNKQPRTEALEGQGCIGERGAVPDCPQNGLEAQE